MNPDYKSPKWQKRRLEILTRDDYKCSDCGSEGEQLHVHHIYYVLGRKPWQYPDWSLVTLCSTCHKKRHDKVAGDFFEWENLIAGLCANEWETEVVSDLITVLEQRKRVTGFDGNLMSLAMCSLHIEEVAS